MKRLALVLPYYGTLPKYFPFFLKSLEGKCFDVLCFTDLEVGGHPDNFIVTRLSFDALKALAEKKLGIPVNPSCPYKLCDLKPFYGKIFEDYLQDYQYWGFGDCDLVYGELLNTMLPELIAKDYDVISFRRNWMSGSFSWLKNGEPTNGLYLRVAGYKDMLARPQYQYFDELGGPWHVAVEDGKMGVEDCERLQDSFTAAVWRSKDLKVFRENVISESLLRGNERIRMSGTQLYRDETEIPIFHYVECKGLPLFAKGYRSRRYGEIGDYVITRTGFYCSSLEWHCRALICLWRWCLVRWANFSWTLKNRGMAGVMRLMASHLNPRLLRRCGPGSADVN